MKVGDLVKIAPHCANKHRMAIVVRTEEWERNGVWIKYLDGKGSGIGLSKDGYAMITNLVLLSEAPEH
jgi:hypothetical protein